MDDVQISALRPDEVDECRRMQAVVWQHYFRTERNTDVPLLTRSRLNLKYYMKKDGGEIFVARYNEKIVGSIVCHVWGSVGWFGPFEVDPNFQGRGIGKRLAGAAVEYLRGQGCNTVGLETMTASTRNVAFYTKLGFSPKKLSFVLHKDLTLKHPEPTDAEPREIEISDLEMLRRAWDDIHPGLDYSAEVEATRKYGLGRIVGLESGEMLSHVIFHDYELIENSDTALVKLMVCNPDELGLLDWCEREALASGKKGIFVRFYQGNGISLGALLARGYCLTGVLVRMQSDGKDEQTEWGHIACWSG